MSQISLFNIPSLIINQLIQNSPKVKASSNKHSDLISKGCDVRRAGYKSPVASNTDKACKEEEMISKERKQLSLFGDNWVYRRTLKKSPDTP